MIKAYFHRFTSALLVAAAALTIYSCTEEELPGYDIPYGYYLDAESVELNVSEWTLEVGDTFTLEATVLPTDVYYGEVTWSSSDESVATVSSAGVVTAVELGTTTIIATSVQTETVSGQVTITVAEEVVDLESIEIYRLMTGEVVDAIAVPVNDTVSLGIVYHPENATNTDIEWEMDMAEYASVGKGTGVVTGKMLGSCVVTARSLGDRSITADCAVTVQYIDIEDLTIFARITIVDEETEEETEELVYDSYTIGVTQEIELDYDTEPYNATVASIAWSSSDVNIATVDEDGFVTGQGMGTATITATITDANGNTASSTFSVSVEKVIATSISLTSTYSSIRPGEAIEEDIVVKTTPSYGIPDELVWTVSPAGIVTIDEHIGTYGAVTATLTAGSTTGEFTVTATYASDETIAASITLSIEQATNVNIDPEFHGASFPMTDGSVQLSWTYFNTGSGTGSYDAPTITWSSSDASVATVSSTGLVTFSNYTTYGDVTISAESSYDGTIETVDISIPAGYWRELYDVQKSVGTSNGTHYGSSYFLFNGTSAVWNSAGYITNSPTAYASTTVYPDSDNTNIVYDYQGRADFWCFDETICLLNGKTFPYLAVHIDNVPAKGTGNVKYQSIQFSFTDASTSSTTVKITVGSYDGFSSDSRITPRFLSDNTVILTLNLASTNNAYIYTNLEESSTSYSQPVMSFNHFLYGYSTDQTDDDGIVTSSAMTTFTYNLYSIQTFATEDDIEAYIASEGLTEVEM